MARLRLMRTPFLVALLVVNLLTCPMRCLPCQAETTGDDTAAPATCCCSQHCEPNAESAPLNSRTSERSELPCDGECACPGCICDGAVRCGEIEFCVSTDVVNWLHEVDLVDQSCRGVGAILFRHGPPDPVRMTGRQVRVAHQSWVI